jgi:hypothetical protein
VAAKSGRAWVVPHYSGDEIAIGFAVTIALHAIPLMLIVLKVVRPLSMTLDDKPVVAKPVIAANVLKLGAPLDPKKLPDRLVPKLNTAPKHDILASRDDPTHQNDAGPPPPNATESDQTHKEKPDPFAEDAGRTRPEIGSDAGVEGGLETDPNKVHAGDMYALKLSGFFHDRWTIPTVITPAEEKRLCVVYQINITPRMVVWHMRTDPIKSSGNALFDDSARTMLQKLLDDRSVLPEPPNDVADQWKGRTVNLTLGDGKSCQ